MRLSNHSDAAPFAATCTASPLRRLKAALLPTVPSEALRVGEPPQGVIDQVNRLLYNTRVRPGDVAWQGYLERPVL